MKRIFLNLRMPPKKAHRLVGVDFELGRLIKSFLFRMLDSFLGGKTSNILLDLSLFLTNQSLYCLKLLQQFPESWIF